MAAVTTESHSIETVSAPSTADPEAPAVRERETVVVERERRRGRGGLLGFLARWLWRLLAVLLILGLLGGLLFLGVTLVLRSDVPRGIAEDVATGLLKHDVSLGGLDVGWGGHVELTDLALRLPSEAGEGRGPLVAEVPRATAELGPLPMLAVKFLTGGNLLPESVTAESPRVYMTQDDDGEWTLPRSAELLASAGGKSDPNAPTGPITLPPLPALTVSDGTIVVRNNEGVERVADGLRVDADSPSPLIYQADLELPGFLDVSAELIPTNGRNQTVRLSATGLNDLAEPYLPGLPPLDVTATWDGSFTGDGGVAGRVRFDESSTLQGIGLGGAVAVSAGGAGGVVEVAPDGLTLSNLPGGLGEAVVRAGTITAGGPALGVDDLLVEVAGGSVLVSTLTLDPDALAGTLVVGFTGVAPPGLDDSSLSGTAEGSLWLSDYGEVRARLGVRGGRGRGREPGRDVQRGRRGRGGGVPQLRDARRAVQRAGGGPHRRRGGPDDAAAAGGGAGAGAAGGRQPVRRARHNRGAGRAGRAAGERAVLPASAGERLARVLRRLGRGQGVAGGVAADGRAAAAGTWGRSPPGRSGRGRGRAW